MATHAEYDGGGFGLPAQVLVMEEVVKFEGNPCPAFGTFETGVFRA